MTFHAPLFVQPAGGDPTINVPALDFRNLIQGLLWGAGQGVFAGPWSAQGGLLVTQRAAGANFSVDIAAGVGVVQGDDITGQGMYAVYNDAAFNLATPVAPGSGTRTHRLVVQIQDHLSNGAWGAGVYAAVPTIVQDTGSGLPAEPPSALTLAYISIAAGQLSVLNANITDKRPLTGFVPLVQDTWHNLGGFISGWSASTAQYKGLPSGDVAVRFANVSVPGTPPADGTVIVTAANGLPAGYRPQASPPPRLVCAAGGTGTETPALLFNTDGSIQVFGVGATSIARLDCYGTVFTAP